MAMAQSPAGIPPEWETRKMLADLASEVQRIKPMLDQVTAKDWIASGASETYVAQLKSAKAEIDYLVGSTKMLSEQPERLTVALETFFRLEAVEAMLGSLIRGIRKYQNPAVADLLQASLNGAVARHETLRQYLVQLANEKEQEFRVVDEEAQRCRGMLSRMPKPGASQAGKKTERK